LLEGEPECSRLARAAAGDALSARLSKRLDAALAAADGPSFEAVAAFVLAAGAPRPAPPPGRPPPSSRLPAALAVAGGVNPFDHGRTISRLACDLRRRGCLVVELTPRDLLDGGRRGAGGALLAAARQLVGAEAEADDVAGIRAWYEQEVVPVALRGGIVVGAKAARSASCPPSPSSDTAAAPTAKATSVPEEAQKKRKARAAAAMASEEKESAVVPVAAAVDDPTAAAATFAAATATAAAATTATAAPSAALPCSARRPALSVHAGTPPPIVFVIEAVEASDPAVLGDLLRLLQHAFVSFGVFFFWISSQPLPSLSFSLSHLFSRN
jgi:Origin recognition complex (ORC) subunit 3 N-terminus